MAIGISAYGAYVPAARLPRDLIAEEWGGFSMGGEKAVASHDEDSLTLAVGAALNCFPAGEARDLEGVLFASTTSPYREKQIAATIAAVLDCPAEVRTADFTDSLRAGTSALLAAIDRAEAAGRAVLVAAADCRVAEPDSMGEQSNGDAASAIVIGADPIAEVVATYSFSDEFLGSFRADGQDYAKSFPGFDTKLGYGRQLATAVKGVLERAGVKPDEVALAALAGPNARAPQGIAKAAGLDPKRQLQDTLWAVVGDVGCAQPLLLLTAALERAKPGDLVLVASYGDGGDALLLRATDRITAFRPTRALAAQIEVKRTLRSYGRYLRYRRLLKKDPPAQDLSSPVVLFRDRQKLLPLYGGRCRACGTVQYPAHRVCIECSDRSGLEPVKLARTGKVFTYVQDHVREAPESPVTTAVVDLDGGGRLLLEVTDCAPDKVEIEMPVELTFRRLHQGFGMNNYFWKARPTSA